MLPFPIRDPNDNSRFLTMLGLCGKPLGELPTEFKNSWEKCTVCLGMYFSTVADFMRHIHLIHPGQPSNLFSEHPYSCNFRLPRPVDSTGLPFGPYSYCNTRFASKKELQDHKNSSTPPHKISNKRKGIDFTFIFLR
jgi:hypothetical protein